MTVTKAAFIWGIRQQESGGNYSAGNPSGALGAYQILGSNLPSWSKSALGYVVSASQFLASPHLQDAIADYKLGQLFDKYGPEGAASAWYSGDPSLANSTKPQPGGPSIASYVDSVMKHATQAPAGVTLPLSEQPINAGPTPTVIGGDDDGGGGGLLDLPKDIIHFFGKATDSLTETGKFFWAFTQPATWVRIGAGYVGTMCLIAGIVCLGIAAMQGSSE
jgi:hypothetical protein